MPNSLCSGARIFPVQLALFSAPTPVPVRPYSQHHTGDGQKNGNTRHMGLKLFALAALKEH